MTRDALANLVPVHFSSEKDALHATEIEEKCNPTLEMLARLDKKPT